MQVKEPMEKNMETEEAIMGNLLSSVFETVETLPLNEPLRVELGYGLLFLVDKEKNSLFVKKIKELRDKYSFPKINIIDMPTLNYYEYNITSYGKEIEKVTTTKENALDDIIQSIVKYVDIIVGGKK